MSASRDSTEVIGTIVHLLELDSTIQRRRNFVVPGRHGTTKLGLIMRLQFRCRLRYAKQLEIALNVLDDQPPFLV